MHPVSEQGVADISDGNNNILKPLVFRLFPNLKQIAIISSGFGDVYAFNMLSLLCIIGDAVLPQSFETLVIKDKHREWLERAFGKEVEKQFAAKKLRIELQSRRRIKAGTARSTGL